MSTVLGRSLALAFGGLVVGLGLVLALFGGDLRKRWGGPAPEGNPLSDKEDARPLPALSPPQPSRPREQGAAEPSSPAETPPARAAAPPATAPPAAASSASVAPSFDVVRVEPNGESVVAGRGAPDDKVELLVDGKPVAQTRTDRDGQFALVPPPLPAGSSEIVLRSTGADGREIRSKQSVAVAVSGTPAAKPLVALTAPDKPTVVLSQPDAAKDKPADKSAPLRIVSVDAQEGGRLFVNSEAQPGATLRLYLNDTLIVPAQAGADGKTTFTIGRGVQPGAYRVRIDQIDRETGKVRSRAEVPFTVPELQPRIAARAPDPAPAVASPEVVRGEAKARPSADLRQPAEARQPGEARRPAEARQASGLPEPKAAAPARVAGPSAAPQRQEAAAPPPVAAMAPVESAKPAPAPGKPPAAASAETARPTSEPGSAFVAEISTARISRGDSLWQISRRTYGKGDRYTVIYDANQDQIRDPDLIYPGQIFVLPEDRAVPGQGGRKRG